MKTKITLKRFLVCLTICLAVSKVTYGQNLNCVLVDGKAYAADAYTSKFIKAAVNRNAVNCESASVKEAASMRQKKINIVEATPEQHKLITAQISKSRQQRIDKKLKKEGL